MTTDEGLNHVGMAQHHAMANAIRVGEHLLSRMS